MKNTSLSALAAFLFYFSLVGCDDTTTHNPSTVDFSHGTGSVTKSNVVKLTNEAILASGVFISVPDEINFSNWKGPCVTRLGPDHVLASYTCLGDKPEFGCPEMAGTAEIIGDPLRSETGNGTTQLIMRSFSLPCEPSNVFDWNANLVFSGKVMCGSFSGRSGDRYAEMDSGCLYKEKGLVLIQDGDNKDVVLKSLETNDDCTSSRIVWIDKGGEQTFECQTDEATEECFEDINSILSVKDCVPL